jgi:GxxExxY protein
MFDSTTLVYMTKRPLPDENIFQCALDVYRELGSGLSEKVYQTALAVAMRERGMMVEVERPIPVSYHGHVVGVIFADLVVNGEVVLELKAVAKLSTVYSIKCSQYLRHSGIKTGYVVNFPPTDQPVEMVVSHAAC